MAPELDAIDAVVARARHHAATVLPPERAADVEIALAELLANTVRHALPVGGATAPVRIEIVEGDDALHITVTDAGAAQPDDLYEDVPAPHEIDPMAESGRGLPLILATADRVCATPLAGANQTELSFLREVTR